MNSNVHVVMELWSLKPCATMESTFAKVVAWRCPSCGDILDPVILRNRISRYSQKHKTAGRNEDDRLLA